MAGRTFFELITWHYGVDLVEHGYTLTARFPPEETITSLLTADN